MFTLTNTTALGHFIKKYLYMSLLFGGMILMIFACDNETEIPPEPDPTDSIPDVTDSVPGPGSQIDPNILSEHLVLSEATKITGSLPTASDGGLKIDVSDTIYVIKGYPYGNRIQILPEINGQGRTTGSDVSGMYVKIVGSDFYFDTPGGAVATAWIDELGDHHTTYTFSLDLDLTDLPDVTYPFSTEVILQPHDDAGTPLDEFDRTVTIEDPENSCNDIRRPPIITFWQWEFSISIDGNGDVDVFSAPGMFFDGSNVVGGCCNTICNCTNWPPFNGCSDQSNNYIEMEIDPFYMPNYEFLWFWADGRAEVAAQDIAKNFDRSNSNVCTGEVAYFFDDKQDFGEGTHDFTPGATTLNLDFPNFSGFGRPFPQSEIIYTCNSLLMIQIGGEGETGKVYKQFDPNDLYDPFTDPFAFENFWFD